MKGSSIDTHLGNVSVDVNVIRQYAGSVANECFGIIGMANVNVTDGLVRLLKINSADLSRGIQVTIDENNKFILGFHIIVAYGVSVHAVVENLISNVKYKVEEYTGIEIGRIDVFVEDVKVID